jgi:transcriptional regulator with XRE-family HTH domain
MNIKQARKAKGMTQKELAQAAGVSLSYIERLERGWMPESKLQKVLEVLDLHKE